MEMLKIAMKISNKWVPIILNFRKSIKISETLVDKNLESEEIIIKYLKKATRLKSGDSFGELALLLSAPRSATVKAVWDSEMATIDKKQFLNIIGKVQEIQIQKVRHHLRAIETWNNQEDPNVQRIFKILQSQLASLYGVNCS